MKKIKNISLLIALIMTFGVLFVGCGGKAPVYYGSWEITKAPTCTHAGEETRAGIGNSELTQSRPVPALGHDYGEWVEITAPTVSEPGLQRAYCKHDNTHCIEDEIPMLTGGGSAPQPVPESPAIPADGTGIFVLGGYSNYITEEKIYALVKDFEAYCNENAIPRAFIGWRMYTGNVAAISAAVRADNDVDILLGVGNNIDSAGNLDGGCVKQKSAAVTIYNDGGSNDATRRHARLNDDDLTKAFWTYIFTERAVTILLSIPS